VVTVDLARPLDFLEALDVDGRRFIRNRRTFGLHARQVAGSEALTVRAADGRLCAIAGLYHDPSGEAEAWLAVGEALSAHLLPVLRLLRRAAEAVSAANPEGLTAVAYIHPRSVAGDRLAAWLGFEAEGVSETPLGRLNTWRRRF
jgi:hypothetical protein